MRICPQPFDKRNQAAGTDYCHQTVEPVALLLENVSSLAKIERSVVVPALENIVTWHMMDKMMDKFFASMTQDEKREKHSVSPHKRICGQSLCTYNV